MKRIIYLILIVLSFGCCVTNVGTQYITTGVVLVPDYAPQIQTSKFCCVDTLIQVPEPMTYIDEGNILCTLIGYDCFGNSKSYEFQVKRLNDE